MPRSPGYAAARARLIAARYVRSDQPRIKVRLPRPSDPILTRSLLALAVGIVLLVAGVLIDPSLALIDQLTED